MKSFRIKIPDMLIQKMMVSFSALSLAYAGYLCHRSYDAMQLRKNADQLQDSDPRLAAAYRLSADYRLKGFLGERVSPDEFLLEGPTPSERWYKD